MFRCEECQEVTRPHDLQTLVVTAWRPKSYPRQEVPKKFGEVFAGPKYGNAGAGYEALKVRAVGPCCADKVRPALPPTPLEIAARAPQAPLAVAVAQQALPSLPRLHGSQHDQKLAARGA